ncbi:uncharacterized protein LOC119555226 [Drosophila subpulchrella]|uniref:uncharacterized protein LOC119555226 n=1 Tax=Drosophila subpulchrella TaxID=1486046 RepID=UPI0018A160D6|nr:uncharacterized protein LOC119555226 [Drosophila subpulchrella]
MSTLPFLLSVADELDNIHSQSYMDDFGLGFHPHRQYYRTPTIQLSLPASTDWTGSGRDWSGHAAVGNRHSRYRSYKFYDDSQNNLEEEEQPAEEPMQQLPMEQVELPQQLVQQDNQTISQGQQPSSGSATSAPARQGLGMVNSHSHDVGVGGMGLNLKAGEEEDDENIDRTVRMYNLSKKCCKNYYRHALETGPGASGKMKCSNLRSESHKSSSSSEESLQKIPSPIEFLTCFLVKKSRTPKASVPVGQPLKKT